jgi:hypothetical protein
MDSLSNCRCPYLVDDLTEADWPHVLYLQVARDWEQVIAVCPLPTIERSLTFAIMQLCVCMQIGGHPLTIP